MNPANTYKSTGFVRNTWIVSFWFVGATLFDARQMFDTQDVKADEFLREIVSDGRLPEAVETCANAALSDFDPIRQKALLKVRSSSKKKIWPT